MQESTAVLHHYGQTVSLQSAKLQLTFWTLFTKALDCLTNIGLHFQPTSCQFTEQATLFLLLNSQGHSSIRFFLLDLSQHWPWSEQIRAFSFTLVTLGYDCNERALPCEICLPCTIMHMSDLLTLGCLGCTVVAWRNRGYLQRRL